MILQDRGKEYIVPIKKRHLIKVRSEIAKTIGNVKNIKVYIGGKEIIKGNKICG